MKRWRAYPEDPPGVEVERIGWRKHLATVLTIGLWPPRTARYQLHWLAKVMWSQRRNREFWRGWAADYVPAEGRRITAYGWTRRQALVRLARARDEGRKGA